MNKKKWYRYTIKEYLAFKGFNFVIYKNMNEPEGNFLREINHAKAKQNVSRFLFSVNLRDCDCDCVIVEPKPHQHLASKNAAGVYLTWHLPLVGIRCTGHIIQMCTDNRNLKNSVSPKLEVSEVTYWACLIGIPDEIILRVGRCRDPTLCCSQFLGSSF